MHGATSMMSEETSNSKDVGRFEKMARMAVLLLRVFNSSKVDPPGATDSSCLTATSQQEAGTRRRKVNRQQMSLSELAKPGARQIISEKVQQRLQLELVKDPTALLTNQHKNQIVVSEDVQTTLTNSPWNRDHVEIEQACQELNCCPAFSDYSPSIQKSLCKIGWYQRLGPGRVIIKEGHLPACFYFILSGTVQVVRRGSERTEFLEAGQTFGAMAILKHMPREASFIARTETELLAISKSDYIDLALRQTCKSFQQNKHFSFCKTINLLKHWPISSLESQPELCKVAKFKPNTVIVKDSRKSDWVYVVMAGSCRVVKRFVDSTEAVGRRKTLQSYPATDLGPSKLALAAAATGGSSSRSSNRGGGGGGGDQAQDPSDNLSDALSTPTRNKAIRQSRSLGSLQPARSREKQLLNYSPHPVVRKQFLVQLQILQPKDLFGLSTVLYQEEPSVTLVSNGVELVLISKDFITDHLNSELKVKLQRQVIQYPSEEAMRKRIRDHYAWNAYKQTMTNQMKRRV